MSRESSGGCSARLILIRKSQKRPRWSPDIGFVVYLGACRLTKSERTDHQHAIAASNYTYLLLRPDAPARLDGLEEGRVLLVRLRVFEGQS